MQSFLLDYFFKNKDKLAQGIISLFRDGQIDDAINLMVLAQQEHYDPNHAMKTFITHWLQNYNPSIAQQLADALEKNQMSKDGIGSIHLLLLKMRDEAEEERKQITASNIEAQATLAALEVNNSTNNQTDNSFNSFKKSMQLAKRKLKSSLSCFGIFPNSNENHNPPPQQTFTPKRQSKN